MRRTLLLALTLAATAGLVPAPARAEVAETLTYVKDLGLATPLPGGAWEVQLLTGPPLRTHGADGPEASDPLATRGARPPACAEDYHQRILYGRPAGAPDRLEEARSAIRAAIWGMNAALDAAAVASGNRHADYRVRCDGAGEILVEGFVNHGMPTFADIVDAARLAGAVDRAVDYTIFYDDPSPSVCGSATLRADDRLAADNKNNEATGYAVAYSDCWDAATLMHETAHMQGAVQPASPHSTGGGGHCRDEVDVLCYSDGGDRDTGMSIRCSGGSRFDCGDDDYFDAAPEAGEWLESHWNLGSPLNRFVAFGDLAPGEDPGIHSGLTQVICTVKGLLPLIGGGHSCEPSQAGPGPDPGAPAAASRRGVDLRSARLAGRAVAVRMICPSACKGQLRVAQRGGGRIATGSFRVPAARATEVRVAIPRRVRRRWDRARRTPRVRVTAREAGAAASVSRTLTLAR